MKGLILAGGSGTRLQPMTKYVNKHLLPIYDVPQIDNCINKLKECGIKDIGVILGGEHAVQIAHYLGDDYDYIWQGKPTGLAKAVQRARPWVGESNFVVHLGDQYLEAPIKPYMERFNKSGNDIGLLLKYDKKANRHSVVTVVGDKITNIVEKPSEPEDGLVMVGVYFFKPTIFKVIEDLKPSARGEYELSDAVFKAYKEGRKVGFEVLEGFWMDTGTKDNILKASMFQSLIKEQGG